MELLERGRHLEALEQWLKEVAAGEGRLVLLGGEAGVGKTSVVDEFCRVAHGRARLHRGACDSRCTPGPLGPLLDIAADAGGELDRLLIEASPRDQVFRAALNAFRGGLTPTLVIIEDAHWADEATLDLIRYLARRLESVRSLVVVTYRDDEVGPNHPFRVVMGDLATTKCVRRLKLDLLTEEGIGALATGSGLNAASLHRLTGGNPFFATEVLADDALGAGIPATVRDAVLARSIGLTPDGRDALEAAAVIGSPIDLELLASVAETPGDAIEACLAGGMLIATAPRTLAFRHELARNAIYDAISPMRRRDLHRRVLDALLHEPASMRNTALLAHHAEAAADRNAVLEHAPAAARNALALGASREATAQYARALRFAAGLPDDERLALLEDYADAADLAGSGYAAVTVREEMIQLARQSGDRVREAEHLGWLGATLAVDGRYEAAARATNEALAILAEMPEGAAHAQAYCHQAHVLSNMGAVRSAVEWGERAIALATGIGDVRSLAYALNTVGETRLTSGEVDQGRADLEHCVVIAEEAGLDGFVAAALANLGSGFAEIHRFDAAERLLNGAIAYAREREEDNWTRWSVAWLAHTRLFQGNWTEAEQLADEVLCVSAVTPDSAGQTLGLESAAAMPAYVRIVALLVKGRLLARRGDPAAGPLLDEALALAGPDATFRRLAPIRIARAELAWLTGDRARAVEEIADASSLDAGHRQAWLEAELALWNRRVGEGSGQTGCLETPHGHEINGDWRAAVAMWEQCDSPYEAALARLHGDEGAIREALAEFERLGARPAAACAAQRLRELGARGIPRGPRPVTRSNPANLTARELEILPMLAAGQRNNDIAAGLFVSAKTVEHHVSSILTKLGVRSRTDVAGAVSRFGVIPIEKDRGSLSAR